MAMLVALGLAVPFAVPTLAQAQEPPDIVVTTSVLGSVVQDLVGDAADVSVLMGSGVDPHDWSPSAQDIEAVYDADLVIVNGLGLEEGLLDAIAEAEASGIRVFQATDHITVRMTGEEHEGEDEAHEAIEHACGHFGDDPVAVADGGAAPDDHTRYAITLTDGSATLTLDRDEAGDVSIFLGADVPLALTDASGAALEAEEMMAVGDECEAIAMVATYELAEGTTTLALGPAAGIDTVDLVWEEAGHGHHHGPEDPHFWVDPVAMRDVVVALTPALAEVGVDVDDADLVARLDALDGEVRGQLDSIPADARKLVTGHESMGYFADRYGFESVGTVIPGLSSQGEVSASELAKLTDVIKAEGVTVVFTEIGTPTAVVEAIAAETGARVVELPSHTLPEDGSYFTFIRDIAGSITEALS